MKWAIHFWTALKARLGGLTGFKSETSPAEAPVQGHQTNYSPTPAIPQVSAAERTRIWQKWEAVAPSRMVAFQDAADTCPLDPAGRYVWASQLSAAIAPALHTFEVALRNAMHQSLMQHHGRTDWFDKPGLLLPDERNLVRRAKNKVSQRKASPTPDDIVAEVMFGFWCALLNGPYEPAIFVPCLSRGFRNLPVPLQIRTDLHSKVIQIKDVRNRVFHHEPIWNYPGIDQIEAELWALAEALYPEYAILSQDQSKFQQVFHDRPACKLALDNSLATCLANGRIQP